MEEEQNSSELRRDSAALENAGVVASELRVESLMVPTLPSPSPQSTQISAPVAIVMSAPSPRTSTSMSLHPSARGSHSIKEVDLQPPTKVATSAGLDVPALRVTSVATTSPGSSRKPSQQPASMARPSTALLPPPQYGPMGPRSPRSLRSRSIMSMSTATAASRRSSRMSTVSKQAQVDLGLGLSPGLRELISRLADTKDVGLIAYLSAVPGEPQRGGSRQPLPPPVRVVRKQSVRPIKSIMKMSKNQVRFEPTYQIEPLRPFKVDRVTTLLRTALETGLTDATYSEQWAGDACRILAAYMTNSVKSMDFSRYKIATKVTVMERNFQGTQTVLRALWDTDRDRYCFARKKTTSLIGVAVVFAVYWE